MKISAIIVTYNRPKALEAILKSILNQKFLPYEVIVADDGSTPDTKAIVSKFSGNSRIKIKHVWQEDKGFRISSIRNRAIELSSGNFLVFSDGDLIFHPSFFYDFKNNMQTGMATIGSRVFLKKASLKKIESVQNFKNKIGICSFQIDQNRLNALRLPILSKKVSRSGFSRKLRGGLLGISKQDILAVNGWNEDYSGWGLEDSELLARLFHKGLQFRKLKLAGITYHLWHPVLDRSKLETNEELLTSCLNLQSAWCANGLIKGERS